VIDASFAVAGPQLARIARPGQRLSAAQVAAHLQGMRHIVLATVSPRGRPFVGPLDAFFLRGRFWATTGAEAQRVRHMETNPNVSAVHFSGDDFAVTVHGRATLFRRGAPEIDEIHAIMADWYKSSPFEWGEIVFIRIDPEMVLTFAQHPEQFP
jgi:general stress protein 26